MDSKVVGFFAITAMLGIISAAAGFEGEANTVKLSEVSVEDYSCVYPSGPVFALGILAAVFTIITRIYISVSFGGSSCCRSNPSSTTISKLLFVLSWVASVVSTILLLAAAAGLSNRERGQTDSYGYITCYVVKPKVFAAGAVLALLIEVLAIAAYVIISSVSLPAAANVDLEKYLTLPSN